MKSATHLRGNWPATNGSRQRQSSSPASPETLVKAAGQWLLIAAGSWGLAGCGINEGAITSRWHPSGSEAVAIPASSLQVGTAGGTIRVSHSLPAFGLSKTPISRAEYRRCVSAGACTPPAWTEGACAAGAVGIGAPASPAPEGSSEPTNVPITCVSPEQAAAFCRWDGGRLPTTDEWTLGARGVTVRRYAWGDEPPTCDRHARIAFTSQPGGCCDKSCDDPATGAVGQHPGGASPFGVQDVLLTEMEFVAGHADSVWRACSLPNHYCVVRGTNPGAIDGFLPVAKGSDSDELKSVVRPVSFRCAYLGGSL